MSISHQLSIQDVSAAFQLNSDGTYTLSLRKGEKETSVQGKFPQTTAIEMKTIDAKVPLSDSLFGKSSKVQQRTEEEWKQYYQEIKDKYAEKQRQSKWNTLLKVANYLGKTVKESDVDEYTEWKKTHWCSANRWKAMKVFLECRSENNVSNSDSSESDL